MKSKLTILVSGMIATDPWQGGATWAVLQYVLGLRQLGHEVYLVEPIPAEKLRPSNSPLAGSDNAAYFHHVTKRFDLAQRASLLDQSSRETVGLTHAELTQVARRADLLINISGMLTDEDLFSAIPGRVYLDLDPAFNQLWTSVQGVDLHHEGHTHFVTIGQAIGEPGCSVPTCGRRWLKTWQPIVLNRWPKANGAKRQALTTVGHWRGYGSVDHNGVKYGQKAHSLRPLFNLPKMTEEKFALALAIHPAEIQDLQSLKANGWDLLDPSHVTDTPDNYQYFIRESKAEFGIAKSGYVNSHCGWFSDRSVCYLASGRPVIAQETGFSHYIPTGEGLFAFTKGEDVVAAIEALNQDYQHQSSKARALAEEYFDSDKVLPRLLGMVSRGG